MNLFELRFGDTDKAWTDWRNEQVDDRPAEIIAQIGEVATRNDPKPYAGTSEMIAVPLRHEPIDILSQGV